MLVLMGEAGERRFLGLAYAASLCPYVDAWSALSTSIQPGKWIRSAPPALSEPSRADLFLEGEARGFRMDGYTFYTLPASATGRQFHPATLPSDEVAIARASAALRDCPTTREVAIWKGCRFVANISKDRET